MRQIIFALGLQALASTVLLGLGGWLVIKGELSLGQLVAAELIVTMIVAAFAKLGKHVEGFYDLLASVDKLGVLFDLPVEDQSGILANSVSGPCEVNLNAVDVGPSIAGFSLSAQSGERVAIYGRSGSGKSSLGALLYGTTGPKRGTLAVDGIDPRDYRPDILRQRVALVGEPEVFHGTIDENIHLHRPAVMPTDVHRALYLVGLQSVVDAFPDGAETLLTSGGHPLSANQIRLLSIARAFAGDPGLIVIDGTLDALADDDVDIVVEALTRLPASWTVIVLTGRRSLADRFDRTIELHPSAPALAEELV